MKYITLFLISASLAATAFAQNGVLKGSVLDSSSGVGLESATVSLFNKDSVLLYYQLTDKTGSFSFEKIPSKIE